uniref:IST1 homolog n=1 Tax=Corethron hystrix TaxID=216773 RepID=A0A7S1C0S0_9STRA|mmetsp:Transcript_9561/g.21224  ORF Transcript_9561/g.21224 Transcript_9561/m.21224 type:complete len:344 (+) Transcript_9561:151-1182(+)
MVSWFFNSNKLKPNLKMAVHRLQISANKKLAQNKLTRRQIATLLSESPPKEEKAKIRAEALVREEWTLEAYDILELQCDIIGERIRLIESSKECPEDLVSTIATVIWASSVIDVPELKEVRKQFRLKYGGKFEEAALSDSSGLVNSRVKKKLGVHPPSAGIVLTYLNEVCREYSVEWESISTLPTENEEAERRGDKIEVSQWPGSTEMAKPTAPPTGYSVPEVGADSDIYVPPIPVGGMHVVKAENILLVKPAPEKYESGSGSGGPPGEGNMPVVSAAPVAKTVGLTDAEDCLHIPEAPTVPVPPPPENPSFIGAPDDTQGNGEPSKNSEYDDLAARFSKLKR